MSDALKLALTITAADLASGVLSRFRERITGAGAAARAVQKDYDRMVGSINRGVKALAVTGYIGAKMRPGINAAAELQGEMIGVRAELSGANTDAAELAKHLTEVRKTAFGVQAATPFDIGQIVALEKELIKAGAQVQDVVGEKGAAAAAAALATYEKMDPVLAGTALIGIGTPFQIAADGYANLADQISRAASASTTGAAEIAEGAKYAAGPLAALGRSTEEMLALSAVMAQVGVTGSMAGTSLKNFFLNASKQKVFQDANGNLKSTAEIITILREQLDGMGDAKKQTVLTKIFGQEGLPVAIALLNKGKGSFEDIVQSMQNALPLSEKLKQQMEGFNRQLDSLQGTGKSTLSVLFEPALAPLTELIAKTNEWTAALGLAAMENENIGKAVTYGAGGIAAAIGTYGVLKLLQGGAAGLRVLKGLKGVGGVAGNVAAGKALEAAAGVQPVFVVNMPEGGMLAGAVGSVGPVADIVKGGSWRTMLAGAGRALPWLAAAGTAVDLASSYTDREKTAADKVDDTVEAAGGLAGAIAGAKGGALAGAFLGPIGSAVGTVIGGIGGYVLGKWGGDKLGDVITRGAPRSALAGDELLREDAARAALAAVPAKFNGEVVVRVRPERGAEARTERARSDHPGVDLQAETETGLRAGGAW